MMKESIIYVLAILFKSWSWVNLALFLIPPKTSLSLDHGWALSAETVLVGWLAGLETVKSGPA